MGPTKSQVRNLPTDLDTAQTSTNTTQATERRWAGGGVGAVRGGEEQSAANTTQSTASTTQSTANSHKQKKQSTATHTTVSSNHNTVNSRHNTLNSRHDQIKAVTNKQISVSAFDLFTTDTYILNQVLSRRIQYTIRTQFIRTQELCPVYHDAAYSHIFWIPLKFCEHSKGKPA